MKEEVSNIITYRDMQQSDKALIYATWLKGLRYGNDWFKEIDQDIYFKEYHKVIEVLLARSTVIIVCDKVDPDTILGYTVFEKNEDQSSVLHWVYVKDAWRKLGICKSLIPPKLTTVTHLTKVGKAIKPADVKFNPFFT